MAAKRPAGEEGPVPPAKRPTVPLTPLHVPPATSQEDLDVKILQVQTNIGWIEGGVDPMHKSTDIIFAYTHVLYLIVGCYCVVIRFKIAS